jgi:hypothetical protein
MLPRFQKLARRRPIGPASMGAIPPFPLDFPLGKTQCSLIFEDKFGTTSTRPCRDTLVCASEKLCLAILIKTMEQRGFSS